MPPPAPPGPDEPAWRQAQRWIEDPVGFWERCASEYGETFTIRLGSLGDVALFSRPEDAKRIFALPADSYECRQYNEHYKHVMGAKSLLVSDGADHKRRRRLLGPSLVRGKSPGDWASVREVARGVASSWPVGEPFAPLPEAHKIALRVMLELVFGEPYRGVSEEILGWFAEEVRPGSGSSSPWARFAHLQPVLRGRIAEAAREARARPNPGGGLLFDALITARDEAGARLDDEEIQDHIFTLIVAGVDPVALALAWALYWVHESPGALAALRAELGALGSPPDPAAVAAAPYLGAAVQESMRMVPVVATPSGRRLTRPAEVGGWAFEAGATLLPCTHLIHRRPEVFPEPAEFRPERFLGRSYAPHEYLPFGGGPRYCIGANLGTLEVAGSLAAILEMWDLEPAHEGRVRPVRSGTLLAPSEGMRLVARGPAGGVRR